MMFWSNPNPDSSVESFVSLLPVFACPLSLSLSRAWPCRGPLPHPYYFWDLSVKEMAHQLVTSSHMSEFRTSNFESWFYNVINIVLKCKNLHTLQQCKWRGILYAVIRHQQPLGILNNKMLALGNHPPYFLNCLPWYPAGTWLVFKILLSWYPAGTWLVFKILLSWYPAGTWLVFKILLSWYPAGTWSVPTRYHSQKILKVKSESSFT